MTPKTIAGFTGRHIPPRPKQTVQLTRIITVSGAWSVCHMVAPDQWDSARHELPGYEIYTANLRGHGFEDPPHNLSLSTYEDDLVEFLKRNGPAYLMAHSMMGLVCQKVANRVPELVQGLIVIASSPPGVPGIDGVPFQLRFTRPQYIWAMATGRAFRLTPDDERFVCGKATITLGLESGLATRQVLLRQYPVKPVTRPMLVVAAGRDQLLTLASQRQLWRFHRGSTPYIVENAGHMVHCEPDGSKQLFNEVREWLQHHPR